MGDDLCYEENFINNGILFEGYSELSENFHKEDENRIDDRTCLFQFAEERQRSWSCQQECEGEEILGLVRRDGRSESVYSWRRKRNAAYFERDGRNCPQSSSTEKNEKKSGQTLWKHFVSTSCKHSVVCRLVLLFPNIFTSSPLPGHDYLTSASTDEIGILTTERNFT